MGLHDVMAIGKNWCFTINNYTDNDINLLKEIDCKYIICGAEICPTTGTPHIQGYVNFPTDKSMKQLSKMIPRGRLEKCIGNAQHNITYCSKENNILYTKGKAPAQGKRKDLEEVKDDIMEGRVRSDDIAINQPMVYHQYGRTILKIEDIAMRRKFRTEMTEGIWIYGPKGVGKSHEAFKDFNPATHYLWNYDKGWQDGYCQQDTVIINEFRGQIPYSELLELIDKWPKTVSRRNREPMPFTSKKVIITSALPPCEVYHNLNEKDSLEQLYDRIQVIELKGESRRIKKT